LIKWEKVKSGKGKKRRKRRNVTQSKRLHDLFFPLPLHRIPISYQVLPSIFSPFITHWHLCLRGSKKTGYPVL